MTDKALALGFAPHLVYQAALLQEKYASDLPEGLFWFLLFEAGHRDRGHLRLSMDEQGLARALSEWDWGCDRDVETDALRKTLTEEIRSRARQWVKNCPALFLNSDAPYVLEKGKLYTRRQLRRERNLLKSFSHHLQGTPSFLKGFDSRERDKALAALDTDTREQISAETLQALENLSRCPLSVISGGPGTGKTTSLVYLLFLLEQMEKIRSCSFNIVLCAPTGRAAKRMEEALRVSRKMEASTLHKLLGLGRSAGPRWSKKHPLPADLVVVDEASMVDLGVMQCLLEALAPDTALLLIGDKDQLPSVESGALLGDMLQQHKQVGHPLHGAVTMLEKVYRSDREILDLADAIRQGNTGLLDRMRSTDFRKSDAVQLGALPGAPEELPPWVLDGFRLSGASPAFSCRVEDYERVRGDIDRWFELYRNQVLLSPLRKGLWGVESLNDYIRKRLTGDPRVIFHGLPVMITRNDYELNLFNGDRGVLFSFQNLFYAFFPSGDGGYQTVPLSFLKYWEVCYVQTIHKSQGSEYLRVLVLLPPGGERMMYRELLYTAVTRARRELRLLADSGSLESCLKQAVFRESGLSDFFTGGTKLV